jgi:hypothetical protein
MMLLKLGSKTAFRYGFSDFFIDNMEISGRKQYFLDEVLWKQTCKLKAKLSIYTEFRQ